MLVLNSLLIELDRSSIAVCIIIEVLVILANSEACATRRRCCLGTYIFIAVFVKNTNGEVWVPTKVVCHQMRERRTSLSQCDLGVRIISLCTCSKAMNERCLHKGRKLVCIGPT